MSIIEELDLIFETELLELYNYKEKVNNKYGIDFNVFEYFTHKQWNKELSEDHISNFIANLLDPNMTHGQSEDFVLNFVKMLIENSENNISNLLHEMKLPRMKNGL